MNPCKALSARASASAGRLVILLTVSGVSFGLVSCAEVPAKPAPPHPASASAPPPPAAQPVSTQVFVYPTSGQSPDRLSRDRYECYNWAVKQSGFDPSQPQLAPHQRVQVVPMPPPGTNTLAGAATGAIIGAAVSSPFNTGAGAAGGAILGGAIGAISDASRQAQAKQIQQHYDQRSSADQARVDEQASNYRRALTACLEGRGYTVK